jgi:DNA replication protein DnaC
MRLLQRAGFPVPQSLEDDDRHRVPWPSTLTWADLETGAFIDTHRHLVLYGAVGTGKSHRATALGIRACEQGRAVRFFTVTDLVVRLSEARRAGTVERLLQDLHRTELLVLDEWGYVPVDKEGAPRLFRMIADRDETRSLILTTNLEFSKWGGLFTDDPRAAAMIDRLAHHGHLLLLTGERDRMTHALMKARCLPPDDTSERKGVDSLGLSPLARILRLLAGDRLYGGPVPPDPARASGWGLCGPPRSPSPRGDPVSDHPGGLGGD